MSDFNKRLVLIRWKDAMGGVRAGWRDIKTMTAPPADCLSVGWLLLDEETHVKIVPHIALGDPTEGDAELAIPKVWVAEITDLIEKPKRKR